jgi:alginate O-acetyltransferase complex protein AlgI
MIFSSTLFVFIFLPAVLLFYYVIPRRFLTARNTVLLVSSLFFYAWGEPKNILLMLLSISANYAFGLLMGDVSKNKKRRRLWLVLAVVFNLGLLGYFKYWNFFTAGKLWNVILPIGISFFTFQIMSYVFDVYFGTVAVQKSLPKLALYISFFPQLIAGPIVRYIDIEKQLSEREVTADIFVSGAVRFVHGFAKKILLSNIIAITADSIFNGEVQMTASVAWLGAIAYALQIYFDFSGYSDMAIGMGHMFGFNFLENFNYPYAAVSVRDFWRRWHISLSTWFRDYLYIPLGGNRLGSARTYLNLIIVFACTGFWHGASISFIVWGLYHGLFLILERAFLGKILDRLPRFIGRIYSLLVILLGWVIFRAETLTDAASYIGNMFNFGNIGLDSAISLTDRLTLFVFVAALILSTPVIPYIKEKLLIVKYGSAVSDTLILCGVTVLFSLSIVFLTGSDYNPFIYFRF